MNKNAVKNKGFQKWNSEILEEVKVFPIGKERFAVWKHKQEYLFFLLSLGEYQYYCSNQKEIPKLIHLNYATLIKRKKKKKKKTSLSERRQSYLSFHLF